MPIAMQVSISDRSDGVMRGGRVDLGKGIILDMVFSRFD